MSAKKKRVVTEKPPKRIGWFEEYACGCVSETVKTKRDLVGYCGTHGDDRRHVHPDYQVPHDP